MNTHMCLRRPITSRTEAFPPARSAVVTPMIHEVLASPGHPLEGEARSNLEELFGQDFSQVRVHTDAAAAASADAIGALAYTVGHHVVFAVGQYQPDSSGGRQLLAHELTHVVQQSTAVSGARPEFAVSDPYETHERQADAVSQGTAPASAISPSARQGVVHRQHRAPGSVSVRSPVAEEAITQLSDFSAGVVGRALTADELTLARGVFGASIDFARVRLIPTDVLQYRTVGNNIRVPHDFTLANEDMAETLIHELTHVWQYQHGGTSYISHSIQSQIVAAGRGSRNFAYGYELTPDSSFFDFSPEQQGSIVQNYFAMRRDQASIAHAAGSAGFYNSNHQGPDGFPVQLNAAERTAEIGRELPLHQRVIAQMRAALPTPEATILLQRASEVMRMPGPDVFQDPTREITQIKPVLEIRF